MIRKTALLFLILLPCCTLRAQIVAGNGSDSRVVFDMSLKNKFEYASDTKKVRFEVRNSRIGLKGKLGEWVSLRTQVELSNEGKFEVLDMYGTIQLFEGFKVSLGQQPVSLYNDYMTSPATMMFANRTFSAKYITSSRDIGVLALYETKAAGIPLSIEAGLFNASKINQPVWTENPGYTARITAGNGKGFKSSLKIYRYPFSKTVDLFMTGADFRYSGERTRVEIEAINRNNLATGEVMFSPSAQGAYSFPLSKSKIFRNITPAIRWDAMGYDFLKRGIGVNRITAGVALGLV